MGFEYFLYYLMIICVSSAEEFSRKLTSYHNPGCQGDYCSSVKVVYVKAEGPNDTLHHLWDFTHKPSVFLAATSNAAKLNPISWDQFQDESNKVISFSEDPVYSFGIVLNKMWEYNDVNDTGLLDRNNHSDTYVQALDMENFSWTILNCTCVNGTDAAELKVQGSNYSTNGSSSVQGAVTLVLRAFGFRDHSEELPHLLHSANCTQIELVLDNLKTNSNFTNSRFAVDMLLASNDQANTTAVIESRKSLDDENSPGVFTLIDLQTPMASSGKGGYLQWRPVAYVAKKRDISNSTETNIYGISDVSNHSSQLNHTLLYAYYSSSVDNYLVQSTTVSFGLKEDGFYKKTNYTSWTFMMGYGKPPDESFSLLVILVISIGLGLPALLIIISGIFMTVRRISQKKDDLFLNR